MLKKFFILQIFLFLGTRIISAPFTDNGDGTVKDNATGLVWQRCSRGQSNNSTCSGTATTVNWSGALSYCSSLPLAGRTWRLPNINELYSLVDTTRTASPTINTTYFPNTVANDYWSSTRNSFVWNPIFLTALELAQAPYTPEIWSVSFLDGSILRFGDGDIRYVRCVSGP